MTKLTIVLGPGGVGKTTLSASIALAAARRGERTAVVTVDPAKRLAQALGSEQLPHQPGAVVAQPGFFAATLDRSRAWDEMVARCADQRAVPPERVERLFANRYYQHLRDELGGSAEIITTDYLANLLGEGRFDRIVVDTPPAHDALGFLDAPDRFARFMDARILELLIGQGSFRLSRKLVLKVLARLTGQEMLDDLIDFLRLTREVFAYMGDRGREIVQRQRDEGTDYLLVTAPDREGEIAAQRLAADLERRELTLSAAFANRMVAEPPVAEWHQTPCPEWQAFGEQRADVRHAQAVRDQSRLQDLSQRLAPVPIFAVAKLAHEPQSLADLQVLADQIPEGLWSA